MRAVLLGSALCAAMAAAAAAANRTAEAAIRPAPGLAVARAAHTATLLSDGTVLVAGGCTGDSCELDSRGATTEVFQPKSGRFTPGPRLPAPIVGHSATRLADGKVLLAGGWDDSGLTDRAYLYDPGSRTFAATGSMQAARGGFTATRLRDGRVLFAGGSSNGAPLRSAELYDPAKREVHPHRLNDHGPHRTRGGHPGRRSDPGRRRQRRGRARARGRRALRPAHRHVLEDR